MRVASSAVARFILSALRCSQHIHVLAEGIVQMTQTTDWYIRELSAALAEIVDLCDDCAIAGSIPCDRHEKMFGHILPLTKEPSKEQV